MKKYRLCYEFLFLPKGSFSYKSDNRSAQSTSYYTQEIERVNSIQ